MNIISIIVILILVFSFIGGLTRGAVKSFFSIISLIIAIPVAGIFYSSMANLLSFLPDQNWEFFLGFFIVLAITSIILAFIFYFPRKILENTWSEGLLFRLAGGALNLLSSAIGLVMFTLVFSTYPVWDWLNQTLADSTVMTWLVNELTFVQSFLPEIMRRTGSTII